MSAKRTTAQPRRWPQDSPPSHWSPHEDAVWVGALKRVAISQILFEVHRDPEAGFWLATRGRLGPRETVAPVRTRTQVQRRGGGPPCGPGATGQRRQTNCRKSRPAAGVAITPFGPRPVKEQE